MSDSPRRISRTSGVIVRPKPASDKSVVESVVGFIQEHVVSHPAKPGDDHEKVQWLKFEKLTTSDLSSYPLCDPDSGADHYFLVIGYTNGVQIWALPESGEAHEVLSLRQGPVRVLRILPVPLIERDDAADRFCQDRPLIVYADASSPGHPYCTARYLSLRTGDEVHNLTFNSPITSIECNQRVVVMCFNERIAAFDALQLKHQFFTVSCYPAPSPNPNPVALGTRWLAYADQKLVSVHQSCGGMTGDGAQSYAATVISAAKSITKGLSLFSESVVNTVTGKAPAPAPVKAPGPENGHIPGIVTVVDVCRVPEGRFSVSPESADVEGLVAHFPAHATEPVSTMSFDPTGTLLITADRLGHNFHVFKLMCHPLTASLGAVHHIYTLHRGDTTAKVQDISFHKDSRWVAVTSMRGTTHIFPINPYGGLPTVRTHTSPRVVNRSTRYQKSAGLDDLEPKARLAAQALSASPTGQSEQPPTRVRQPMTRGNSSNPRLPPYPHPTTVYPLSQIRQSVQIPGLITQTTKTPSVGGQKKVVESVCVCAAFSTARYWAASSPNVAREAGSVSKPLKADRKAPADSLFLMTHYGDLIEYTLDPGAAPDRKPGEEPQLQLGVTARGQWPLLRSVSSPEMSPPLPANNLVISLYDGAGSDVFHPMSRRDSYESLSSDQSGKSDLDEQWLAQVEIVTHMGPHRRLWMGPQFTFKTLQTPQSTTVLSSMSPVLLSQSEEIQHTSTMDIVTEDVELMSLGVQPVRSSPVAMPVRPGKRPSVSSDTSSPTPSLNYQKNALFIEAGSYEQSPHLVEVYGSWPESLPKASGEVTEDQITETLADAMLENSSRDVSSSQDESSDGSGARGTSRSFAARSSPPRSIEHVLVFPSATGTSPDRYS